MAGWLRRAGHGLASDGATVTWSVAEGRRGRRWREVVTTQDGIRSSLLLELDPDGRFAHLELSTASGLLTLHPEGDGTLHGNRIAAGGIEHIEGVPWDPDMLVVVEGSVVSTGAAPADRAPIGYLLVDLGLRLRRSSGPIDASEPDGQGLPRLPDGESWPLERE